MKRTTIIETIVLLYTILFVYTGISKLADYSVFKEQLAESPVLAPIAPFIAAVLPWFEFFLVVMLVIPKWRLRGLYVSCAILMAFTIYIIILLSFSNHLPCSCGGIISLLSWPQHLVFNSSFILLALIGIILQKQQIKDTYKKWNTPNSHNHNTITEI